MDKKNKLNILEKKDCFFNSLKEVNYFLCNINKVFFTTKIIKKLK